MPRPIGTIEIAADKWWTDTGIDVQPGDTLRFEASGTWWDAGHRAGPEGVDIPKLRKLRFLRRARDADWAALIGVAGRFGRGFRIGAGTTTRFAAGGRLHLYFNDVFGFYHNNKGAVTVSIYRE
jgi:hypothetical protein